MTVPAFDMGQLKGEALALTRRWCAIESVRGNDAGLGAMVRELTAWLKEDLAAEIVSVNPAYAPAIVHARIDAGRPMTVILYNMYDVMPAEPRGWSVDPFAGGIFDLPGLGPSFVARGAENNKGPLAGMLIAVRALVRADALPVNVEIVLEGEEESGSRALRGFLKAADCTVKPAVAALFPSLCEYGGGPPRLYLGFAGIARGTVTVASGAWGGPTTPIHSSNAPWIANPASRLIEVLAVLADAPNGRVGEVVLDDEAKALIADLATTFDAEAELVFRKTARYAKSGSTEALLSTLLSTISLNLSSLATDPPHGDAVIPASASAGFDLRTPPGADPDDVIARLRSKLAGRGLEGAEIAVAAVSPGHRFSRHATGVDELLSVYRDHGRPAQIWPWGLGSAPAHAFAGHTPSFLIGGLGRGGNAHGVDEFLTLEGLTRFISSIIGWLIAMGNQRHPKTDKKA